MQSTTLIVNSLKDRLLKDKHLITDLLEPKANQISSKELIKQALQTIQESPLSFGPVNIQGEPQVQEKQSNNQNISTRLKRAMKNKEDKKTEMVPQNCVQNKTSLELIKQSLKQADGNVIIELLSEDVGNDKGSEKSKKSTKTTKTTKTRKTKGKQEQKNKSIVLMEFTEEKSQQSIRSKNILSKDKSQKSIMGKTSRSSGKSLSNQKKHTPKQLPSRSLRSKTPKTELSEKKKPLKGTTSSSKISEKKTPNKKQQENIISKKKPLQYVEPKAKKVVKHPQNPQAYGVNLLKHVNCSENIIKGSRRSESRVGVKVKRPLKFVVDVPVDRKKKPKSKSVSKEDVSSSTKKHPKPDEKHSKHLKTILKEAKEKAKQLPKEKAIKKTISVKKPAIKPIKPKQPEMKQLQFEIAVQIKKFQPPKTPRKEKVLKNIIPIQIEDDKGAGMKGEQENIQKSINLGSLPILEVVSILHKLGLLEQKTFMNFSKNHSNKYVMDFLQKFTSGTLDHFNFKSINFTLLDHRRMSELISNLFPEQYHIGQIKAANADIHTFLKSLYDLSPKKYFDLYKTVDEVSNLNWWKKILENNKKMISRAMQQVKNSNQIAGLNETNIINKGSRVSKKSRVKP